MTDAGADPRVVLDAPLSSADGHRIVEAAAAASLRGGVQLTLTGDATALAHALTTLPHDAERIELWHAAGAGDDDALCAALRRARAEPGAAVVTSASASRVGAWAERELQPMAGGARPALAAVFPTLRHRGEQRDPYALLLDVGASLDASADDLCAFAARGATYARLISANPQPRVALLSRTGGPDAAPERVRLAHARLSGAHGMEYLGLITADRVPAGEADVVVTDGFSGNILLRGFDGVAATAEALLERASHRFRWRMGLGMLGSGLSRLREITDWRGYGGAPLLGYHTLLIRTQRAGSTAPIENAVRLAAKCVRLEAAHHIAAAAIPGSVP